MDFTSGGSSRNFRESLRDASGIIASEIVEEDDDGDEDSTVDGDDVDDKMKMEK